MSAGRSDLAGARGGPRRSAGGFGEAGPLLSPALIALAVAFGLAACKSKSSEPAPASMTASSAQALDVPRDIVYAGSAHLRIVDVALGQAVAGIDLGRAMTAIEFSPDGRRAFVAASDGVREVDVEKHVVVAQLTRFPARALVRSEDGSKLWVLEHEVKLLEGGAREVLPFRVVTLDLEHGSVASTEEIGQRVLWAVPPSGEKRAGLVVTEEGEVRLVRAPASMSGGTPLSVALGAQDKGPLGIRPYVAVSADRRHAYLPVEGASSAVVEVDLERGTTRAIALGRAALLRGLAVSSDGKTLVVDASKEALVVDVEKGTVRGAIELGGQHVGAALAADGRRAYFAQTIDGTGGAITVLRLDPLKVQGRIHLDDISPWVIAVRPRAAVAVR